MHNDMDSSESKALLDDPKLIAIEPPVADPDIINTPSAAVKDVEMADVPIPAVESDEAIDQQMDFVWNVPTTPERSPSAQPNVLPHSEPSKPTSTLDAPHSQSGELPDQRPGFESNVLSPRLQHIAGQVAHTMPATRALPAPRPKPRPAPLKPGDPSPDAWSLLGRNRPKIPASLAPGAKLPIIPKPGVPPANLQPPPTSMTVLMLRAAAEAEAQAIAESQAAIEASKRSIEASNASYGSSLTPHNLPIPSTPNPPAPIVPPTSVDPPHSEPIEVAMVANEPPVAPAGGRVRTLTSAAKSFWDQAAQKEADKQEKRQKKKLDIKKADKVVKAREKSVKKPAVNTKGATQKNPRKKKK